MPHQPYAAVHISATGPGDARPTALQIVKDLGAFGVLRHRSIACTGCSSGIGAETARALYEAGANLFLTARDTNKLETIIEEIVGNSETYKISKDKPLRPKAVPMQLDSLESVRQGALAIRNATDSLYALINNAGVMACPYSTTTDGFETQMGTNHYAHFLLLHEVKPLLLNGATVAEPSRLVNLTSSAHTISPVRFDDISFSGGATYYKWLSYGQSKTANIHMANQVNRIYGAKDLVGLSVHPGVIATELMRHMDRDDHTFLESKGAYTSMNSQEQGAATTVWAVLSPHFKNVENGGRYLADVGESLDHAAYAYDEASEERLWAISSEALNIAA